MNDEPFMFNANLIWLFQSKGVQKVAVTPLFNTAQSHAHGEEALQMLLLWKGKLFNFLYYQCI